MASTLALLLAAATDQELPIIDSPPPAGATASDHRTHHGHHHHPPVVLVFEHPTNGSTVVVDRDALHFSYTLRMATRRRVGRLLTEAEIQALQE